MKTRNNSALLLVIALAVIFGGIRLAHTTKQAPPATYNAEQTHGDVRVVLLRTAKFTVFTDQWFSDSREAKMIGAPAFVVTFLIEVPQEGAFNQVSISSSNILDILVRGKSILDQTEPGLIRGSVGVSQAIESIASTAQVRHPKIAEGKAAFVEERTLQGLRVSEDHVDLNISFKWKGKDLTFNFRDVPVN